MSDSTGTVFVVDDDEPVRDAIGLLLDTVDIDHQSFASAQDFLDAYDRSMTGCLVLDIRMPSMSGMELQAALSAKSVTIPIIFLTGHGNVSMSAKAFRSGAVDFLEKPFNEQVLLQRIEEAIRLDQTNREAVAHRHIVNARMAALTPREREVMRLIVAGHSNKEVARQLELSTRTIETHRGHIMEKTGAHSLADLIALAIASGSHKPK